MMKERMFAETVLHDLSNGYLSKDNFLVQEHNIIKVYEVKYNEINESYGPGNLVMVITISCPPDNKV